MDYSKYRNLLARIFYSWVLFWVIIRQFSHLLFPQLDSPVLTKVIYDLTFWLYKLSGIGSQITQNGVLGWGLVVLIYFSLVILILKPTLRYFPIVVTFLLLLLEITTNIYVTHSMAYMSAMIIISFAFWGSGEGWFDLLWKGARYYCCWLYGSAFLWKIILGAMEDWDSGWYYTLGNIGTNLFLNPDSGMAHFYYFFLEHPWMINLGEKLVFIIEGLFLIGFFTRRWDRILILSEFVIFLSTMIFSDVFFAEQIILILPFISVSSLEKITFKRKGGGG